MTPSDARLGAVCEVLPVQEPGVPDGAAERPADLYAVRDADSAESAQTRGTPLTKPAWSISWKRSVENQRALRMADYRTRAFKERAYCEAVRDAKAAGRPTPTQEEFFGKQPEKRETILEL